MQQPTLNATEIVFAYGDQLWRVSRTGGVAIQFTDGPGQKTNPKFSPDGKWLAFTSADAGNFNLYVMPAEGGQPRQVTYGPGPDRVKGWTPDGRNIPEAGLAQKRKVAVVAVAARRVPGACNNILVRRNINIQISICKMSFLDASAIAPM